MGLIGFKGGLLWLTTPLLPSPSFVCPIVTYITPPLQGVLLGVSGVYCGVNRGAPWKGGEQKGVGRSGRGTPQKKPKTFWVIAVNTRDKKWRKTKSLY